MRFPMSSARCSCAVFESPHSRPVWSDSNCRSDAADVRGVLVQDPFYGALGWPSPLTMLSAGAMQRTTPAPRWQGSGQSLGLSRTDEATRFGASVDGPRRHGRINAPR